MCHRTTAADPCPVATLRLAELAIMGAIGIGTVLVRGAANAFMHDITGAGVRFNHDSVTRHAILADTEGGGINIETERHVDTINLKLEQVVTVREGRQNNVALLPLGPLDETTEVLVVILDRGKWG